MNAALLALLILLCSASSAAAEPISAAIGLTALITSAGVGAATAATIGGFILSSAATIGISLGLAALNKAMSPKPKAGDALSGTETNVQLGGDIARQIPIGIVGAKGHLVYHNSYGLQHEIYQQVYVLADWPCDGLASVWINGKLCTLTGGPATFGVAEYPGLITLVFYDGTQTAADGQLIALAQPPGKWSATSKLTGMAYVYVVFTYQAGAPLYEQGIPRLTFGLRGARLYDPRFDSTNGGSGGQRFDNPATWTFSQNPAIAIYNYLLGFHRGSELILGMGVPIFDVLRDTVIAAANICDEPVILDAGGTEARYRAACYLSADEGVSHAQTLEVLLSTMAGYLYDYGGFYYLQAGAGYTSAATITDDDLVTGAPVTFATKRSRAELINRIHGQWINPADEYQPTSYTPQVSAVGTAEDNEELGRALDLNSVPSQYQAERIAQVRLREVRRQATAGLTLGFEKLTLQAGDWITWASSRYGTRIFRIVNKVVEPINQTVTVDLVETTANVYSWTASDDEGPPVVIGGSIVGSALITQPGGFTVQAVTLFDGSGNEQPGIRFGWSPILDPTVDAVVIEWRQVGTTAASRHSDPSVTDGVYQTTDGVVGGLNYEARATISTTPVRVTTWTNWISITTSETVFNLASAVDPAAAIPTGLSLTSAIETLATGETQTRLDADWNDVTGSLYVRYEIDIKEGAGNFVTFPTTSSNYTWRGLRPGTVVTARVRSITALGTPSGYSSPLVTHTVAADTIPPAAITGLSGSASFQTMFLSWTNPADADFDHTELVAYPTNNRSGAPAYGPTVIAGSPNAVSTHTVTGVTPGSTRYFWVRPFDTSGNAGPYTPLSATGGLALTSQGIISADIAAGAITQTQLANTLRVPDIVTVLPTTGNWTDRIVILQSSGLAYKWDGAGWIRAYGQEVLGVDSIQAATITAGAVGANQIAAKAITTEKLAVGSRNVAFNAEFNVGPSTAPLSGWSFSHAITGGGTAVFDYVPRGDPFRVWAPTGFPNAYSVFSGTPPAASVSFIINVPVLYSGGAQSGYVCSAGNVYEASVALSMHRCSARIRLQFYSAEPLSPATLLGDFAGNVIASNFASGSTHGSVLEFPRSSVMATAPAGAIIVRPYIETTYNGTANPYTFFSALFFAGTSTSALTANNGAPAFAPYQTPGVTIIERGQIRTGEVITEHMVANTIEGDRIKTDTLDAVKVKAGTVLAGSVKVTTAFTGTTPTLDDLADRAARPIDYLNAPPSTFRPHDSTQIFPGVINIFGATTLSSWRDGGDNTQIAGGQIATNTITANKVKVGVRGIEVLGLDFQARSPAATSNIVDWSAGYINYIADDGTPASVLIAAGATVWSPGQSLYWTKGTAFLQLAGSTLGVTSGDNIMLASYGGAGAINVLYGGTIVDGSRITTGSVNANRITANTITATEVLQSQALIVNQAMIADATIGTLKVLDGSITSVYAASGGFGPGGIIVPPAIAALAGRRFLINYVVVDNAALRTSAGSVSQLTRFASAYVQRGGVDTLMQTSWSFDCVVAFSGGVYTTAYPNVVGSIVYAVPADDNYFFYVKNDTGISAHGTISVTELKR